MTKETKQIITANLSLAYCNTPKEYTRMYLEGGESCMSLHLHRGQLTEKIYKSSKLMSSCFYSSIPGLRGICAEYEGKFIARGFMYKGKVLPGFYGFSRALEYLCHINELQYTHGLIEITEDLKVPAIKYQNKWYCPVPYCDFIRQPLYYSFLPEYPEQFIVSPSPKGGGLCIGNFYDYQNWVTIEPTLGPKAKHVGRFQSADEWAY